MMCYVTINWVIYYQNEVAFDSQMFIIEVYVVVPRR